MPRLIIRLEINPKVEITAILENSSQATLSISFDHMPLSPGLYEEIRLCRDACGEAHMKTILATGELGSLANVYKTSMIAMMAGKHPWFSF